MKCKYSKCFHEESDEFVMTGKYHNTPYHAECLKTKEDIVKIADYFKDNFNEHILYPQLLSVINDIIFNKKVTTDQLMIGLKYYKSHNKTLSYAPGLYYVIQNKDVQKEWSKYNAHYVKTNIQSKNHDSELEIDSDFTYKTQKKKTLGDIFNE